jgi:hypothetical protein
MREDGDRRSLTQDVLDKELEKRGHCFVRLER